MDPIADMLTQIRNALAVRKDTVEVDCSRVNEKVAKILEETGFVGRVHKVKRGGRKRPCLSIELLYREGGNPRITKLRRISKPGRRIYKRKASLKPVLGGYGLGIISTSKGVMTTKEAKKRNLGGEIICEVW